MHLSYIDVAHYIFFHALFFTLSSSETIATKITANAKPKTVKKEKKTTPIDRQVSVGDVGCHCWTTSGMDGRCDIGAQRATREMGHERTKQRAQREGLDSLTFPEAQRKKIS